METMSTQMYMALKNAGVSEKEAQGADAALGELEKEVIGLKAGHTLTHWMVGINITLTMAVIAFLLSQ